MSLRAHTHHTKCVFSTFVCAFDTRGSSHTCVLLLHTPEYASLACLKTRVSIYSCVTGMCVQNANSERARGVCLKYIYKLQMHFNMKLFMCGVNMKLFIMRVYEHVCMVGCDIVGNCCILSCE